MAERFRINVKVRGDERIYDLLTRLRGVAFNDVLDQTGAIYLNRTRTRFLAKTAPDGTRWIDSLAALQRRLSGRDGGTLFDTGNLFHSISLGKVQETPVTGNPINYRSIYTRVPYSAVHQYGLFGNEVREHIGIAVEDRAIFRKAVNAKINKVLLR